MPRCEAQVICCIGSIARGTMSFSLRMTYHLILGSVGTREVRRWLIVLFIKPQAKSKLSTAAFYTLIQSLFLLAFDQLLIPRSPRCWVTRQSSATAPSMYRGTNTFQRRHVPLRASRHALWRYYLRMGRRERMRNRAYTPIFGGDENFIFGFDSALIRPNHE
ncbi:hypothetical protein DFH94DRAFT_75255 [Russula ochroleuca]|uniref:Uncharacterized protein n=1 Tax=Russula ochroleuca TaxID=152965 RepID=A0A9P5MSX7_9AGAM|nr:hypothetical protein DFH94DRAFT_75255 [Russula ochroleuca]